MCSFWSSLVCQERVISLKALPEKKMSAEDVIVSPKPSRSPPSQVPLNERILSSLSRRTVAAHPWHDLEIGQIFSFFLFYFGNILVMLLFSLNYSVLFFGNILVMLFFF